MKRLHLFWAILLTLLSQFGCDGQQLETVSAALVLDKVVLGQIGGFYLRIYEGTQFSCAVPLDSMEPTTHQAFKFEIDPLTTEADITFGNISAGNNYTFLIDGYEGWNDYGETPQQKVTGSVIARGCRDGIIVKEKTTTVIYLVMQPYSKPGDTDAGVDTGEDGGSDAEVDAGLDVTPDTGEDVPFDIPSSNP